MSDVTTTLEELGAEVDELQQRSDDLRDRRKHAAARAYQDGVERKEICAALRITEPTLSKWLKEQGVRLGGRGN
ncbi:DNA binding protein [Gordonia phage VanLee]|uniref:DNA binding protein n=1 Tax=Gordonia phage VanLee TaxID=2845816 RepID=A0A8F2D9T3_9CAUD|nr:DNA binding protein [Gordonia phage VanLee]QWS68248.1 DNA binding protein [Gordonia phage VanLee]